MEKASLKDKTAKGLFWGGISSGVQQLLAVLIGIVLLKVLTPDDYGMVGLLTIFITIANTLQESGFTAALVNKEEFKDEDYNSVFWFSIGLSVLMYVLLFFSAPLIADFFNQPELIPLSRILFLTFVIGSLGTAHNAVLFKKMMVKQRAKIDIFSTAICGCVGIYMAMNGYGYWALAYQSLCSYTVSALLRWYFSPWKPSFSFHFRPVKEMFSFSFKLLLANIINIIQGNIFSVLLGRYYTKTDVGFYSQGLKWANMGSQVVNGMVQSITQPLFVKVRDEKERMGTVFRKMLRFIAFLSFPCLFGLAFIGRDFMLLINSNWLPCVPILQMYCIWGAFAPICILCTQIMISRGHSSIYFYYSVFFAVLSIGAAIATLSYGIYWMAFAVIIVSFLSLLFLLLFVGKQLCVSFKDIMKDILPYLFISMAVFLITYFCTKNMTPSFLKLMAKVFIAIAIYTCTLWKMNSTLFKETLHFFFNRKN